MKKQDIRKEWRQKWRTWFQRLNDQCNKKREVEEEIEKKSTWAGKHGGCEVWEILNELWMNEWAIWHVSPWALQETGVKKWNSAYTAVVQLVDSAAESTNLTLGKLVQWESKNHMWSHSILSSFKKNMTNKGLWFLKHAYCEWIWNSGKKILDFLSDRLCLMMSAKDTGLQVRVQGIWSQTNSCLDAVG